MLRTSPYLREFDSALTNAAASESGVPVRILVGRINLVTIHIGGGGGILQFTSQFVFINKEFSQASRQR
jgi:hypothetical protein